MGREGCSRRGRPRDDGSSRRRLRTRSAPTAGGCTTWRRSRAELVTSDDAAMALVEATPAMTTRWSAPTWSAARPLHHARRAARSAARARRLLAFEPAWAKRADAGGKSAFELLLSTASEEQATVLFEACGNPRPVWVMLDPATAACSAAKRARR